MIRQPIQFSTKIAIAAAAIVVLFMAYEYLAYRQTKINPKQTVVPGVTTLWDGLQKMTKPNARGETWLWEDSKATFGRLFVGLGVGVVLSVLIGVGMGAYPWLEAFFAPPAIVTCPPLTTASLAPPSTICACAPPTESTSVVPAPPVSLKL